MECEQYGKFICFSESAREELFKMSEGQLKMQSQMIAQGIRDAEVKLRKELEGN